MNVINQASGESWAMYHTDCVELAESLPDNSIDYQIMSVPFASLYTYSASSRDFGNCRSTAEFFDHYRFLAREQYRVTQPGRLMSFHCMNLPTSKTRDGVIGLDDFRGQMIRMFLGNEAAELHTAMSILRVRRSIAELEEDAGRILRLERAIDTMREDLESHPGESGFIYHSEVCIWKDPVTAMQRTKALGLLYKQLCKDSAMSRQGIPDYLVTMRKDGTNEHPVSNDTKVKFDSYVGEEAPDRGDGGYRYAIDVWQRYASPVWFDIDMGKTLQYTTAREEHDERHIAPLQLQVIERGIELWSNPGDTVADWFTGIGSTGYVAVKKKRRFIGAELKESYWKSAVKNLQQAEREAMSGSLLGLMEAAEQSA